METSVTMPIPELRSVTEHLAIVDDHCAMDNKSDH